MDTTGSFLYTAIETVRRALEQASTDKYTDDYIVRTVLEEAYAECLSALNMNTDIPVVCKLLLSTVAGTAHYQLPPCIENVMRLVQLDDNGNVIADLRPQNNMAPYGCWWRLEANMLVFDPIPQEVINWYMEYIPSGDLLMHYAADGEVGADGVIILSTAPEIGMLDRRPNAYCGSILRILHAGIPWQERVILTHDVDAGEVTVRIPFDSLPDEGDPVTYEIAPLGHRPVWNMIARKAAMILGEDRGVEQSKLVMLSTSYARSKKAAFDRIGNMQARTGKSMSRYTIDNPDGGIDLWRVGQRQER